MYLITTLLYLILKMLTAHLEGLFFKNIEPIFLVVNKSMALTTPTTANSICSEAKKENKKRKENACNFLCSSKCVKEFFDFISM